MIHSEMWIRIVSLDYVVYAVLLLLTIKCK